jgi:hypothetical protein
LTKYGFGYILGDFFHQTHPVTLLMGDTPPLKNWVRRALLRNLEKTLFTEFAETLAEINRVCQTRLLTCQPKLSHC